MNRKQALARTRNLLNANNIEDSLLEGEILLRHALGINRTELYIGLDNKLSPEHEAVLSRIIERRLNGEPSAYIIGNREFFGLDFYVDSRVLVPRPESEMLVETALELVENQGISTIADIGTGSGAIAVSLASNLPEVEIYAIDISDSALEVARLNCLRHGVAGKVCLLKGDLLDPLPAPVDLIIANLPYVRESELNGNGTLYFEPGIALNGGLDGVDQIRRLCCQVNEKLRPDGNLLLEVGQGQWQPVSELLRGLFPSAKVSVTLDLAGIERVVGLALTEVSTGKS